jgi:hypothetical protein
MNQECIDKIQKQIKVYSLMIAEIEKQDDEDLDSDSFDYTKLNTCNGMKAGLEWVLVNCQ